MLRKFGFKIIALFLLYLLITGGLTGMKKAIAAHFWWMFP
jgi:hypothetical protein